MFWHFRQVIADKRRTGYNRRTKDRPRTKEAVHGEKDKDHPDLGRGHVGRLRAAGRTLRDLPHHVPLPEGKPERRFRIPLYRSDTADVVQDLPYDRRHARQGIRKGKRHVLRRAEARRTLLRSRKRRASVYLRPRLPRHTLPRLFRRSPFPDVSESEATSPEKL